MGNKKRRGGRPKGKPCSPREIEQRRAAAPAAARARSPEGKRASSRNRWIHGRYAKGQLAAIGFAPCKSTCSKYPCLFIKEDKTKPGKACLEKTNLERLEHVAEALMQAIQGEDIGPLNQIAALEMAGNLEILHRLRADISKRGVIVEKELFNSQGHVIGRDYVEHPALKTLIRLCGEMGLNLGEFLATPASASKLRQEEEERETAASIMRRLNERMSNCPPATPIDIKPIKTDTIRESDDG